MTPRSLWLIIIKIIGIYLIISGATYIPQFGIAMYEFSRDFRNESLPNLIEASSFITSIMLFYILIIRYCLVKTDWLIDKLGLERGFIEEKFELNIHRSTALKIAVIVTGALIIMDALPPLCKNIFTFWQFTSSDKGFKENPTSGWIIFYIVKFFVGFFMVTTSRLVVNFIERKRKGVIIPKTNDERDH
jgi:hypothetical protein